MKTEQETTHIINEYEKENPAICGTDTLIKFIQWYDEREKQKIIEDIPEKRISDALTTGTIAITKEGVTNLVNYCLSKSNALKEEKEELITRFAVEFRTQREFWKDKFKNNNEKQKVITKEFEEVEFITKNGKLKAYLRDGLLEITSHNKLVIFPSATNVIYVDEVSSSKKVNKNV